MSRCASCRGLGYLPSRDIRPGEVTGWPPATEPAGPWRRCLECSTAQDLDDIRAARQRRRDDANRPHPGPLPQGVGDVPPEEA